MAGIFREGMEVPQDIDGASAPMKRPAKRPAPAKPKRRMAPRGDMFREGMDVPQDVDGASAGMGMKKGGKVKKEHGGEHYANPAIKRQHERAESKAKERMEEGMMCGGKVKKMSSGGGVRGGGIAKRGVGRGRMC